jgi:hypothetical protein
MNATRWRLRAVTVVACAFACGLSTASLALAPFFA